jgi:hypothetical protein
VSRFDTLPRFETVLAALETFGFLPVSLLESFPFEELDRFPATVFLGFVDAWILAFEADFFDAFARTTVFLGVAFVFLLFFPADGLGI